MSVATPRAATIGIARMSGVPRTAPNTSLKKVVGSNVEAAVVNDGKQLLEEAAAVTTPFCCCSSSACSNPKPEALSTTLELLGTLNGAMGAVTTKAVTQLLLLLLAVSKQNSTTARIVRCCIVEIMLSSFKGVSSLKQSCRFFNTLEVP